MQADAETIAARRVSARGQATRAKLLDAAVAAFGRLGYAATTTQIVADDAGASRGSMLHQFQTRLDMTLATAEHAMRQMMAEGRRRADALGDPRAALLRYPDIFAALQATPAAIALTEILLAARWERDLARRLTPLIAEIDCEIERDIADMSRRAEVREAAAVGARIRLVIAATRGLAIELMFSAARTPIHEAAKALREDFAAFVRARLPARRDSAARGGDKTKRINGEEMQS